jgi:hypothetical protein
LKLLTRTATSILIAACDCLFTHNITSETADLIKMKSFTESAVKKKCSAAAVERQREQQMFHLTTL